VALLFNVPGVPLAKRARITVFSATGPAVGAPILKIGNLLLPLDKVALDA
jgi:hypothetical protein